jgi:hypothetical protein
MDIDSAIRLRGKREQKKTKDILLTVASYRKKLEIVRAKKKLKDCDELIYINEALTPKQSELFAETRSLVKKKTLEATWTRDGKVYVKQNKESSPVTIAKKTDLAKLVNGS